MMPEAPMEMRGMGWRIPASILIGVGWLAFVIIWLFFFASEHSIYRNVAMLFASVLIAVIMLTMLWVGFGLRMGEMHAPGGMERSELRQIRWRVLGSAFLALLWTLFFLVWVFLFADGFSGYQSIAVIIVSLLVLGGLTAALWARWRPGRW